MNAGTLLPLVDGSRAPIMVDLGSQDIPVQLCRSPHCTTLASLLESTPDGWWDGPSQGWRHVVARHAASLDLEPLAPYTRHDRLPAFLTSSLRTPAPTFDEQLDEIRMTKSGQVRTQVRQTFPEGIPETYDAFMTDPRASLNEVCDALHTYFQCVVAPLWPAIRAFLDREIIRLGYVLATQPAGEALNQIHPDIHVDGATLVVGSGGAQVDGPLVGRRLKLTPLMTARAGLLADLHGSGEIKIGYAAPGVEELWGHAREETPSGQLAELLGANRAVILSVLADRETTSGLAPRLDLAPATVSAHLGALAELGLVERARVGRRIYYQRSERGDRLVELFTAPAGPLGGSAAE